VEIVSLLKNANFIKKFFFQFSSQQTPPILSPLPLLSDNGIEEKPFEESKLSGIDRENPFLKIENFFLPEIRLEDCSIQLEIVSLKLSIFKAQNEFKELIKQVHEGEENNKLVVSSDLLKEKIRKLNKHIESSRKSIDSLQSKYDILKGEKNQLKSSLIGISQIITKLNFQLNYLSGPAEEQRNELVKSFQDLVGNILNQ